MRAIKTKPVKLPALNQLLIDVAALTPISEEDANVRFADRLGAAGIQGAINFATEIGVKNIPVRRVDVASREINRYVTVSMIESSQGDAWMKEALSYVNKDCALMGCTNLIRIAGMLSIKDTIAPGKASLESLLEQTPGYRSIDPSSGWFTTISGDNSALASRLKKMLYVAQGPLNVDTIAEALITSSNWLDREDDRAFAFPPVHVLRNLFSSWEWLATIQYNRFSPVEPMAKGVLSNSELVVVDVIESFGGVAMHHEIAAVLMSEPHILTGVAVSMLLASTPIVEKVERGMYRLRGRSLNLQAIAQARLRNREFRGFEIVAVLPGRPITVSIRQSGSDQSAIRRVVYIPGSLVDHIQGVFTHATGLHESIDVRNNAQIRRLSGIAEGLGIRKKEMFLVIFDLEARTFDIVVTPKAGGSGNQVEAAEEGLILDQHKKKPPQK